MLVLAFSKLTALEGRLGARNREAGLVLVGIAPFPLVPDTGDQGLLRLTAEERIQSCAWIQKLIVEFWVFCSPVFVGHNGSNVKFMWWS